jgi:hypothetical protein
MSKRAIQMSFVRPDVDSPVVNTTSIQLDVHDIVKTVVTGVGTIVFGYIILDAGRQVLVAYATK